MIEWWGTMIAWSSAMTIEASSRQKTVLQAEFRSGFSGK
jgi:hypothetical protein